MAGKSSACNRRSAPLAGYRDAEDYYTHSSCGRLLRNIRCPTLVVHALDDPFMTADIVPALDALAPCVTLEVAQSGGHVGFVSAGALGLPYCWLERRLTAYLHDGYKGRVGAHVHPVAIQSAARGRSQSDFYPAPATTLGLAMATST